MVMSVRVCSGKASFRHLKRRLSRDHKRSMRLTTLSRGKSPAASSPPRSESNSSSRVHRHAANPRRENIKLTYDPKCVSKNPTAPRWKPTDATHTDKQYIYICIYIYTTIRIYIYIYIYMYIQRERERARERTLIQLGLVGIFCLE